MLKIRKELSIDISDHVLTPSKKGEKKIIASIEYLSKLFIMPDTPDRFVDFGEALLNMIHEFYQEKGGIHSAISLPELSEIFSSTKAPNDPELIRDVLYEIKEKVIAHSVKVGNPCYIGHMTSAIPYFMILIEMIIASLNQNQIKIETAKASSFVEREFLGWIHRLVFNRPEAFYRKNIQNHELALGSITANGTIANLTALWVAREKAFPSCKGFQGIRKEGVPAAFNFFGCSSAVVLVSELGHFSFDKAVDLLGLGNKSLIRIPVNSRNQIDIKKLRRKIKELNKPGSNCKIVAIIGIAGTTETGNIDDLKELRKVADECGAHYHVDAAWGGATLLSQSHRHILSGVELADSVIIDTHKLFYTPMSMGMALFRNTKDLSKVKYTARYVIRKSSVDQGRFTLEGSRAFDVLKPWASLKIFGTKGFQILFDHAFELTKKMVQSVTASENFEPMNMPQLFIHIYRFAPLYVRHKLFDMIKKSESERGNGAIKKKVRAINNLLNQINVELHRAIRAEDSTFVSRTALKTTQYAPQRIVVLRSITVNPLTTVETINEILNKQEKMGLEIYNKKHKYEMDALIGV